MANKIGAALRGAAAESSRANKIFQRKGLETLHRMRAAFHPDVEGSDPTDFLLGLNIRKKDPIELGTIAEFGGLYDEQLEILAHVLSGDDLAVLKGRQIGSSTAILLAFFLFWFLADQPEEIIILAHTTQAARDLLERVVTMYEGLPTALKKLRPATITQRMIKMEDTKATIKAKGYNQRGGLRSTSISRLLLTEFVLADDPDELLASALSSLGDGQLVIETTALYHGDAMFKEIGKIERGEVDRQFLFFPWSQHRKYRRDDKPLFQSELTADELKLQRDFALDLSQLAWYREKSGAADDKALFQREHPLSVQQAYAQLPNSFVSDDKLDKIATLKTIPNKVHRHQPPSQLTRYVIGVDVAKGHLGDFSSVHVLDARTLDVVATFRSNQTTITHLADKIEMLSREYGVGSPNGLATCNVEANSIGQGVIVLLQERGVPLLRDPQTHEPMETNTRTEPLLRDRLKTVLLREELISLDDFTKNELRSAQVKPDGRIDKDGIKGSHFDGGMSLSYALWAAAKVSIPTIEQQQTATQKAKPTIPAWAMRRSY